MPDMEKVEEWARDFIAYADELDIARDAYRGIMEYIDDALALLKEQDTVDHAQEVLKAHGWKNETEVSGNAAEGNKR